VSPEAGSEHQIALVDRRVAFDRGHGAFVQDGTWDSTSSDSLLVVDPLGKAYPLSGGPITIDKLGYDVDEAPVVPDAWVGLFEPGVELSTSAALCPPSNEPGKPESGSDCQEPPQ
jgi:hypothetical protein